MKKRKNLIVWILIIATVLSIIAMFVCDALVKKDADRCLFNNVNKIPQTKTALLLGTSRLRANGKANDYFFNRIYATASLYKSGKIHAIVISGDNGKKTYNEPEDMKAELVARGIPDSCIYLDFAGFRTYDSVIRMNKIFGQTTFIIVSQKFHNERAIYIAHRFGWKAYGLNAKEVTAFWGLKTSIREKFARVKLFIDLLFNIKPKFLGNPIPIK